ncbi:BglG family transcription antiterminator [Paenibacillus sp. M1]|uniref:BglG family transcription antiterminator n=1 Tax=Paenibacillus haidiansis TaxID=1574488 RepID=A0ABU7VZY1_9BACL
MRKFTARQRQILMFLLNRKNGVTAAEIAAEIKVSVRTVHRELDEMDRGLRTFGLELYRKSGTGISIRKAGGDLPADDDMERFRKQILSEKQIDFSGEERKIMLLCELLEAKEPIKMFALAHNLKVTAATVSNDLDEMERDVNRLNLRMIRRRGYGVELEGAEEHKRAAIARMVSEELNYSELVGPSPFHEREGIRRLLELAGKADLLTVENCLWDMNWNWTEELSEGAYTGLLIALSVTVSRIRKGWHAEGGLSAAAVGPGSGWLKMAGQMAEHLAEVFAIPFSEKEVIYIADLFHRARRESPELAQADMELADIVGRLIDGIEKRTGIPFQEDRLLREGLLEHINPALKRIREGTRIRNPLLGAIRKDYEELFAVVRESVADIGGNLDIPDEEIGFLVMHFGASVERLGQLGRHVRAILVCSSGLSSSRLLATRLAKEMPQIEVLGNASWYEAARLPEEDYDLIISTIELPLPKDRYVRLSPLLTPEDSEKLLSHIQTVTLQKRKLSASEPAYRKEGAIARLGTLGATLSEIISLLEGFSIYELDNTDCALQEIVVKALELVNGAEDDGKSGATPASSSTVALPRHAEPSIADIPAVAERLLERERLASQIIPGTSLALFHTRSRFVNARSLSLFRLKHPLPLEQGAEVTVILLMLASRELSKESLEVLSEISALLLKPELVTLLESGGEGEIRNFLAEELLAFFENN